MNVTVIGTGNMGRGIAYRLVEGGNNVTLVSRDPEGAETLAAELRGIAENAPNIKTAGLHSQIQDEVVVLAVGYTTALELVQQHSVQLAGKILVDITNPLNEAYDGLVTAPGTSAAEEIAKIAPAGAKVVKAFNTNFAGTLVAGQVGGQLLDVFIAGDDKAAIEKVAELVKSGGVRPVEVGPLSRARQLEGLALLGIGLQFIHDLKFSSGFKLAY